MASSRFDSLWTILARDRAEAALAGTGDFPGRNLFGQAADEASCQVPELLVCGAGRDGHRFFFAIIDLSGYFLVLGSGVQQLQEHHVEHYLDLMGLAALGGLGVDDYQFIVPSGQDVRSAGDGGGIDFYPELVLALQGYGVAPLLVLPGAALHHVRVPEVVPGLVEVAGNLGPSAAVVVGLEPDLPLTHIDADQEFGEPGREDVGAMFSEYGHCDTSLP